MIKMEDPESERKNLEHSSSSVLKWILANGYMIGKEIAITGMIVSSAPLVVPPLVVFSAMGVAASVPFGVLFASYACTNKLMSSILLPTQYYYYYYTDHDGFEVDKDECKLGLDDANGDGYGLEVDWNRDAVSDEIDSNTEELVYEDYAKLRGEEEVDDEHLIHSREIGDDANEDEKINIEKVMRQSMGTDEKNGGDANEEHLIHSREIGDENLLDEMNTNNKLEGLEVGIEVKENVADDNVDVLARTPPTRDTNNEKPLAPSREENVDDKKIWDKIGAMRTIVGYKAPAQPTSLGELKALYVFTGVEPPASFEGDLDLDAKLKFLMAIVGVK